MWIIQVESHSAFLFERREAGQLVGAGPIRTAALRFVIGGPGRVLRAGLAASLGSFCSGASPPIALSLWAISGFYVLPIVLKYTTRIGPDEMEQWGT